MVSGRLSLDLELILPDGQVCEGALVHELDARILPIAVCRTSSTQHLLASPPCAATIRLWKRADWLTFSVPDHEHQDTSFPPYRDCSLAGNRSRQQGRRRRPASGSDEGRSDIAGG